MGTQSREWLRTVLRPSVPPGGRLTYDRFMYAQKGRCQHPEGDRIPIIECRALPGEGQSEVGIQSSSKSDLVSVSHERWARSTSSTALASSGTTRPTTSPDRRSRTTSTEFR